ncbi:MAG: proline--tRNA ligase [Candidatus Omnitrophica bacterium]|nr:proline--tRNA ligase [Candidatus Omnitrophota bacterium]
MRWTDTLIPTLREVAKEAEATSHQLLLKAGFIRKLSSGIYSYLPLGLKVLQRISEIVREEMNRSGALELLLPALQPAEIWKQSGRYETLGADKIAFRNRSDQEFVLGPTHEEVVTELAAAYFKTYQALPKILYQIQTKFRDEVRPRFGIIRTKEFIMKDAYSFDVDEAGLEKNYQLMYDTYLRIFKRLGLAVDSVAADPGIMGGNMSHEFMVRSPYGEDRIATCEGCHYLASRDIAARAIPKTKPRASSRKLEAFDTPNLKTIEEISNSFRLKPDQLIKTIFYVADGKPVAACVRGDHEVHEGKLRKLLGAQEIRLARPDEIERASQAPVGFTGPVGLKNVKMIADGDLISGSDFVAGANRKDQHLRHVNVDRDFQPDQVADIRYVQEGDACGECGGKLSLVTAMEVGHVFKLGTRYTKPFAGCYRGRDGKDYPMVMGCYGLGLNRILAAIVEQHHDEKGIKWPVSAAPYPVHLVTVNQREEKTSSAADEIYRELSEAGCDVLYDNRDERAGVKFNDADLIGSPLQVIVSDRNLKNGDLEVKTRCTLQSGMIERKELLPKLQSILREISR